MKQHSANLTGCVNALATYNNISEPCVRVVFDTYMADGYENCYLKSADGVAAPNQSGFTFVVLSDNPTSTSSSSSSKTWIAGPIIGVVAIIALVAGCLWWRRRKKRRRNTIHEISGEPASSEELVMYEKRGAYDNPPVTLETPRQEMPGSNGFYEIEAHSVHELPGSMSPKK